MNTKNNTNKATQQLDDLDAKAPPIDYGVITSGACSTQEAQEKFGELSPQVKEQFLNQFLPSVETLGQDLETQTSTSGRDRAIQWLEDNGAPIVEENIQATIKRFNFR